MKVTESNLIPQALMLAPATLGSTSLTLVWDKPTNYQEVQGYRVYQNGNQIFETATSKTHATITDLSPTTEYSFAVSSVLSDGSEESTSVLTLTTKKQSKFIDVTQAPYNADGTGQTIATAILQQAINDCPADGTILIPEGATILSGAIDLKSNTTFQIDGTLKGSLKPEDYTYKPAQRAAYKGRVNDDGLILTRYEGWEMYCYRSLINGGYLNPDNRLATVCENIRICGKGTVYGGGNELGTAMKQIYADKEKYPQYVSDGMGGRRTRGRLLGFIQCKNVELTGINVENPSCWTIHMIYCDTVTTHGINIKSRGIDNGDGWDPDSSRNCMIFDTSFDTGDDCIAIKSGKNPDGNKINIPAKNIRIFDLNMLGGHGMAIGSEESGGVENVSLRDCKIRNTDYGLELKAHNSRGGYIKNLTMQDCEIDRFMAHSVNYNADGIAAPTLPYFKDITIKNTTIDGTGRAIELIGFTQSNSQDDTNYLSNVNLQNVTLGTKADKDKEIYLEKARDITLTNVKLANGGDPTINLDQETVHGLVVDGKTVQ